MTFEGDCMIRILGLYSCQINSLQLFLEVKVYGNNLLARTASSSFQVLWQPVMNIYVCYYHLILYPYTIYRSAATLFKVPGQPLLTKFT